jgi:uncharacterized protein
MLRSALFGALLALLSWTEASAADQPLSVAVTAPEAGGYYKVGVVSYRDIPFLTVVRQQYDFSCGSAALATLLRYNYGRSVDEATIFKAMYLVGDQASIRRKGFSLADMKTYLASVGYTSDGYRVPLDRYAKAAIPAIVIIRVGHYRHFVVIKGIRDGYVLVGDPANGLREYTVRQFESVWDGLVFIIHDEPHPADRHFNNPTEWARLQQVSLEPAVHLGNLAGDGAVLDAATIFAVRQPSLATFPSPTP